MALPACPDWLCHGTERRALAAFEGLEAAYLFGKRCALGTFRYPGERRHILSSQQTTGLGRGPWTDEHYASLVGRSRRYS